MPVYSLAREFTALCTAITTAVAPGRSDLADQLRRASTSIGLNIAEGAGEFAAREKIRFYRMARRSATESAAILDAFVDTGVLEAERVAEARELARRITVMLVLLVRAIEKRDGRRDRTAEAKDGGEGGG